MIRKITKKEGLALGQGKGGSKLHAIILYIEHWKGLDHLVAVTMAHILVMAISFFTGLVNAFDADILGYDRTYHMCWMWMFNRSVCFADSVKPFPVLRSEQN